MPQICIQFYANYTILATQREGPWHYGPSLDTPLFWQIKLVWEFISLETICPRKIILPEMLHWKEFAPHRCFKNV